MNLDLSGYLYVFLALIFVLALIALLATLARRFGLGYTGRSNSSKDRRLSILEVLTLSPKHRLALIRIDKTEHLILLGANTDLVIDNNVNKTSFSEALEKTKMENNYE